MSLSARELERRCDRLRTVVAALEEIGAQRDELAFVLSALVSARHELRRTEKELEGRRVPQRARRTRNGTADEWADVRRAVRGALELEERNLE